MKRTTESKSEYFVANRKNLTAQLKPNSIAIFNSGDEYSRSADATHTFFQNPDLLYLSGIDQEETTLVLFPDAPNPEWREVLFLKETSDYIRVWEGYKLTQSEASELSGINIVRWNSTLWAQLAQMMLYAENVYINLNEHSRAHYENDYKDLRFFRSLKEKYPLHNYCRMAQLVDTLRMSKQEWELGLIQKASDITIGAFKHILTNLKHFQYEWEVEAEITYFFNKNRAIHAYNPIIAGGKNACILHYNDNDQKLNQGELLLMDFGAAFSNYASDMTRTIPVGGRFSEEQRKYYNACLEVFKHMKSFVSSDHTLIEINKESTRAMERELINIGLLNANDVANQNSDAPLFKKYFPHGVSHYMGMDVHDVGNHYLNVPQNAVLTCEPGIYIDEKALGIRIENDLAVRKGGNLDFFQNCPIEIEEIEDLMM